MTTKTVIVRLLSPRRQRKKTAFGKNRHCNPFAPRSSGINGIIRTPDCVIFRKP